MNQDQRLKEFESILWEMIRTPQSRRLFLASIPLLMASCASRGNQRYREGDNTGQKVSLSPDDERRMTDEVLPEMRKEYPAVPNQDLQKYLSRVGSNVAVSNGLEGNPYRYNFTVVQANFVNAFALPAGTVFVTTPLIEMADSEAELAGVIGHEIGHVKARHAAERMERAKQETKKSILYGIGGGLLGGAAGFGLGKLLCPPKDNACLAKATAIGAAAGAGGGLLVQKFAFMANSQEDELEADRVGFKTSVGAGYSKDHVGLFYSKLQKMEEEHRTKNVPLLSSVTDALSTHPPSRERVAQMNQMAAETSQQGSGKISSKEFEQAKRWAKEWTESHKG